MMDHDTRHRYRSVGASTSVLGDCNWRMLAVGIDTLATTEDQSRGMGGHDRFINTIKGSFYLGIFCHHLSWLCIRVVISAWGLAQHYQNASGACVLAGL